MFPFGRRSATFDPVPVLPHIFESLPDGAGRDGRFLGLLPICPYIFGPPSGDGSMRLPLSASLNHPYAERWLLPNRQTCGSCFEHVAVADTECPSLPTCASELCPDQELYGKANPGNSAAGFPGLFRCRRSGQKRYEPPTKTTSGFLRSLSNIGSYFRPAEMSQRLATLKSKPRPTLMPAAQS